MTGIPLRTYNQDIERLIENNHINEAIANCLYILQSHPKYVDVYRLLGKAFLEKKRFGDAGDILQRVLSSSPDDFISHVGMSIIREDEGNLNEAIWHMERAFEVQPANSAIQDELRRLYGRRDGVEPPRIRLTRGALARMYVKGDLLQQAVAEIRAALAEDPNRLDLQVLLASIYHKNGQRIEAAETASAILRKLPYCITANQIMVDVLSGSERQEESKIFLQRLAQLDPYYAFISPKKPNPEDVPEQVITLEQLELKPEEIATGLGSQTDWTFSLGEDQDESSSGDLEALPEWLTSSHQEQTEVSQPPELSPRQGFDSDESHSTSERVEDVASLSEFQEGDIPSWLEPAGGSQEFEPQPDTDIELPESEPELEKAEIPEWLRKMAPPPGTEQSPKMDGEEIPPWLDNLISDQDDSGDQEEESGRESKTQEQAKHGFIAEVDVPEWLQVGAAAGAGATISAAFTESQDEDHPIGDQETITVSQVDATEDAIPIGDIPDWLIEAERAPTALPFQPETSKPEGPVEELPDWLQDTGRESVEEEPEVLSAIGEELPDWLQEGEEQELMDSDVYLPDWLSEDEQPEAATPASTLEPDILVGAETLEDLPDWLSEDEQPETATPTSTLEPEVMAGAEAIEDLPDWLSEDDKLEEITSMQAEPLQAVEPDTTFPVPAWLLEDDEASEIEFLSELTTSEETSTLVTTLDEEPITIGDTQPSRTELGDREPSPPVIETPPFLLGEEQPLTTPAFDASLPTGDTDATLFGKESLAEEQSEEEELLIEQEDQLQRSLEWVQETVLEEIEAPPASVFEEEPHATQEKIVEEDSEQASSEEFAEIVAEDPEQHAAVPLAGVVSGAASGKPISVDSDDETISIPESDEELMETLAFEEPAIESSKEISDANAAYAWLESHAAKPAEATGGTPQLEGEIETVFEEQLREPELEAESSLEDAPSELEIMTKSPGEEFPIEPLEDADLPGEAGATEPGLELGITVESTQVEPEEDEETVIEVTTSEVVTETGTLVEESTVEMVEIEEPLHEELEEKPPHIGEAEIQPELSSARVALERGDIDSALSSYAKLIESDQLLPEVITDLHALVEDQPDNLHSWQSLGDAYLHANQVQEALEAYNTAQKLLG